MNGAVAEAPPTATPWMQPVTEPSAWTGADLERDRSWEFFLSPAQQDELEAALRQVQRQGLQVAEVTRERFPLPALKETLRADEGRVRYGVIRHGKLGWTAADLLAGNHHTPHRRRADGVPVVG